jgi:hypothetical protein
VCHLGSSAVLLLRVRVHMHVHTCSFLSAFALADAIIVAVVVGRRKKGPAWLFNHFQMNDFGSP